MILWVQFLITAAIVVIAGMSIGRISAELGERWRLGRAWSGAVLLSFATTLPELVTTVSVAARGQAGMALGGILGSVTLNLFILVLADMADPEPIYHRISLGHITTGVLGCALLGIVVSGLALGMGPAAVGWGIGHVSAASLAILVLYGIGQFVLFRQSRTLSSDKTELRADTYFNGLTTRSVVVLYLAVAAVIFVAAYRLGLCAEQLADRYQLSAAFAGATFLGIVTSLPEVTNAVTSARRKEFDLAMGNIFGANAMVVVVLAISDIAAMGGRLFHTVESGQRASALAMAGLAIVMQSVVMGALAIRSAHRVWRLGVTSMLLIVLYTISLLIAYFAQI